MDREDMDRGQIQAQAAFLRARLDEDEAAAKAAWPGPWDLETEVGGFGPVAYVLMPLPHHKGARTGLTRYIPLDSQDADTAAHIARHDPARVLRKVQAKRAILDEWEDADQRRWNLPEGVYEGRDDDERERDDSVAEMLDVVVAHLAAIWSDHPDYP